jgi:hypothetical protein
MDFVWDKKPINIRYVYYKKNGDLTTKCGGIDIGDL